MHPCRENDFTFARTFPHPFLCPFQLLHQNRRRSSNSTPCSRANLRSRRFLRFFAQPTAVSSTLSAVSSYQEWFSNVSGKWTPKTCPTTCRPGGILLLEVHENKSLPLLVGLEPMTFSFPDEHQPKTKRVNHVFTKTV